LLRGADKNVKNEPISVLTLVHASHKLCVFLCIEFISYLSYLIISYHILSYLIISYHILSYYIAKFAKCAPIHFQRASCSVRSWAWQSTHSRTARRSQSSAGLIRCSPLKLLTQAENVGQCRTSWPA
jgi:hypothetical protein